MRVLLFPMLVSCVVAIVTTVARAADTPAASDPPQIPLCMIGDSITWAEEGDCWRQFLLTHIPALAFVGTHTAKLGYSHAGEGGNGTGQVLARLGDIPDCPYYSLLIGTNDNNTLDPMKVEATAKATAGRIVQIVNGLLGKPSARKVFLGSVLPCHTDNPLRDETNSQTNVFLRDQLASFPAGKVVWVEYEAPIRHTPDWEPMIRLHPTPEGYKLLAKILADAIKQEAVGSDGGRGLPPHAVPPRPLPGCGVRVSNLWEGDATGRTRIPIIAGWYTLSFDVVRVTGADPAVTLNGIGDALKTPLHKALKIDPAGAGKRVKFDVFTEYEGYGYSRSPLGLKLAGCEVGRILFEKMRPSMKASVYGVGEYLDTTSETRPGELISRP